MCEPTTIAMLAVAAAGAISSADGQRRAANTQADAMRENLRAQAEGIQAQQIETDQAAAGQMSERARQAMQERGRLTAVFASSGVAGGSQLGALKDPEYGATTDLVTIEANRKAGAVQSGRSMSASFRQTNQGLAAIQQPNYFATGLQIAGAGVNAYAGYQSRQAIKPVPPPNKAG